MTLRAALSWLLKGPTRIVCSTLYYWTAYSVVEAASSEASSVEAALLKAATELADL